MHKLSRLILLIIFSAISIVAQNTDDKQKELIDKSLKLFQQGQIDQAISANKEAADLLRNSPDAKSDKMITALINGAFMKKAKLEREEKALKAKLEQNPLKPREKREETIYDEVRSSALDIENNLREALEISQTVNRSETPLAATVMRDLALILQKNYYPQEVAISRKRIDESEALLTKALAIQEKTLGATHEKTLQTFFDSITLYNKFNNLVKLSSLLPKYLANAEKKYGQNAKELLPALRLQASNLYTIKSDDELKPVLERIKQIDSQSGELFPVREISSVQGKRKLPRVPRELIPSGKSKLIEEVMVEIDEKGRVTKAEAKDTLNPGLRQALEEAARDTQFNPVKFNGNPVSARGKIVYNLSFTKESIGF